MKLKTIEASSSVSRTASAATRPRGFARAITIGWDCPSRAEDAPDDVGALVAEEERPGGLERQDRRGRGAVELARDASRVAPQVLVTTGEAVVVEQTRHEPGRVLTPRAAAGHGGERGGQWLGGGRVDELDGGVDAGVGVHPAGDRVEEGLRQLGVGLPGQTPGVGTVGRAPQRRDRGTGRRAARAAGRGLPRGRPRRDRAFRPSPAAPRASPQPRNGPAPVR